MIRIHLIRTAFITALAMVFLHIFAVAFYLYSFYWWFDLPVHLLAGFFAGLSSLWLCWTKMREVSLPRIFTVALLGVLVFGGTWELFEYLAGITLNGIGNYPLDVLKDMAMDILGGFAAVFYVTARGFNKKS